MTDLELFMAESGRSVDEVLDRLVPAADTPPERLHEAIRWSLFGGGKRLRPVLVLAVGEAFGADRDSLLRTAGSVEMMHTYSLIHDDLPSMDDDDLRRGRETCHKKFGEATAILAGDVLETLAFAAVAEDDTLPAPLRLELIRDLARAAGTPHGMVAGQQLDLAAEGKSISLDAINNIHRLKTGSLISISAKAGAMIGDADASEIAAIADFGFDLGLLFQITDDLLDVTQTTESLGKTAGKDVSAAKATYPSVCGIEQTRVLAEETFHKALAHLDRISGDTALLRSFAGYILDRRF